MSVDKLQARIRKLKNPSVIDMTATPDMIPGWLLEQEGGFLPAYERFCLDILEKLKPIVPAVRFQLGYFSLYGQAGTALLERLLRVAAKMGYYIILDVPESPSESVAADSAKWLFANGSEYVFDAILTGAYSGSDVLKPYVEYLSNAGKAIFVVTRTANKSAVEFQDLLTGTRLAHMAVADMVWRLGQPFIQRCGYSQIACVAAASSAASVQAIRGKHQQVFLLLDGYDYPNSNAKNCSYAFDKLGHGAAACANAGVLRAWAQENCCAEDYAEEAYRAAERMKKNLCRYITVL